MRTLSSFDPWFKPGPADGPNAPGADVIGRMYLLRGERVRVLARWGPGDGPRNVLVELSGGRRVVRPFRGLRRPPKA